MTDPSMMDQLARLNLAVQAMEERFGQGEVTVGNLENIKSTLDDIRLRLWALLQASSNETSEAFQQRFRVRRTTELCSRIATDLRAGTMDQHNPDLKDLRAAMMVLGNSMSGS